MRLRNKKTGQTGYYLHTHRDYKNGRIKVAVLEDGKPFSEFKPYEPIYDYDSLQKLIEDWEDYKPAEPLIKDEKIRKAVRAWAEVNEYDKLWVYHDNEAISFYNEDDDDNEIIFNTMKKFGLRHLKCYTVEELCGDDEE